MLIIQEPGDTCTDDSERTSPVMPYRYSAAAEQPRRKISVEPELLFFSGWEEKMQLWLGYNTDRSR